MSGPPHTLSSAVEPTATNRTTLIDDLDAAHQPGENLVWSAAMGLAWKELEGLAGGPIELADSDAASAAGEIVRRLNASDVEAVAIDTASCVARAGLQEPRFLGELRDEIRRKFGADSEAIPSESSPSLVLAYAQVQKRLVFDPPLLRASWPLSFLKSFVESFGLWHREGDDWEALSRQVRIHHPCYVEADVETMSDEEYDVMYDEFVVELLTTEPTDRVIVAVLAPGPTLRATVERAISFLDRHAADHPKARLDTKEKFEVPIVDFERTRQYDELFGQRMANPNLKAQRIGEVSSRVRFRLDEGGAHFQAEAVMRGLWMPPRDLICDRPFLVMIVRRGARVPMFALWIANAELMVKKELPEISFDR